MLPGVNQMITNLQQHCLGRKIGLLSNLLEMNYKTFVYYVEWRIVHQLRGGMPNTLATHCRWWTRPPLKQPDRDLKVQIEVEQRNNHSSRTFHRLPRTAHARTQHYSEGE